MFASAVAFALVIELSAAEGGETAAREADMFGEATDAPAASTPTAGASDAPPGADRESAMFGETATPALSSAVVPTASAFGGSGLIEEANKALDVGGQLFLRFNGNLRDGDELGEMRMSSPSLINAYMDVRPTDRVRGFVQLRLTYDMTVSPGELNAFGQAQQPFAILFDQGWVKLDLGRVAYVTAGRQRIRWGTGRFWNPTDFINQDVRNSTDIFDSRLGVNLVKVHFPLESLGWNLYVLGAFDGIDLLEDTGVGARAEFLFWQTEVAISSLVKKDQPLRLGVDASTALWIFDLRAEGTLQRGLAKPRYSGKLDYETMTLPKEQDTDDDFFVSGVFGVDVQIPYGDQDNVILGAEYFYNQAGYENAKIYPFLISQGAFVPFYLGQHYAAAYAVAQSPFSFNNTSITLSTLGNLSDQSFLTRLDVQQLVLTYVTLNVFAAAHYGRRGEFKLGIEIPPVPAIPQLANGFELPNDMLDVGVALRMNL